ncbi:MAG: ABC transporter ATP-binding protein [Solobacterium sp.]|jgi:energy-coupling factor transport system ATP-binding protein|nr:ABC transporter ATP-binding protein [Solobacterium sp.]MCH4050105.1 ABC transporter ATP-binding protein [Solobacterium sp.]MCH4073790.1 ABC transporter ATP-binding protein [Solobacterium sp.]MCI1314437.1 ABC transporter ATP-binding protein [Solobacterium sp.]MCI1346634.1 ABC transporter ATP-binding protein [Solobacterium sp.]
MEPIISFRNFSFQYNAQSEPTLHDINLDIYPGQKILIAGPSGSGKSTIGHCLNGLIPNSYHGEMKGSLIVDGIDAGKASLFDLSQKVGTVLQDSDGQFIGLSVGEDIAFALENNRVPQPEMKERVAKIAAMVDMSNLIASNPHSLSGGQKQRVSLAGVMVDDVDILLFDEPLANLDPKTGETAIELIDELAGAGKTVIIIEHRLEDVLHRHVDRIVLVNEGRIIMDDTPDAVLASGILPQQGIREPLYVTACRYAGIRVTPEMKPSSLSTMDLSKCRAPLQAWYDANKVRNFPVEDEPLLEVKNVSFSYNGRKKVLQNVSFSVNAGEMVSIVGKNGAGKSTLSQIIVGFLNPDEGQVTLKGEDLARYTISERAEYVGLVLQNPNQMISKAMIFDEIAFGLRIRHVDEEEVKERVYQVMKICGLYPMRSWPISALSYGQKKRVTIASILVLNPKVLILDEPTAGQDYYHYSEIMSFLKTLNENGQTIILITHDMHLMLEYTERAIVLCESQKLADEKAYEVLCDRQLSTRANLKETSLFTLAEKAGIDEPQKFVECFIDYDRKEREKSCR